MRLIIRLLALLGPVFAAAALGAARQAGALARLHVSDGKAAGFVAACFLVGWLVLTVTRKPASGQGQNRGRRGGRQQSSGYIYPRQGR